MAENPEECRRRALECASLALTTSDPAAREIFTSFAKRWLALAIDEEEPQTLLEEWGDPSSAVRLIIHTRPDVLRNAQDAVAFLGLVIYAITASFFKLGRRSEPDVKRETTQDALDQ